MLQRVFAESSTEVLHQPLQQESHGTRGAGPPEAPKPKHANTLKNSGLLCQKLFGNSAWRGQHWRVSAAAHSGGHGASKEVWGPTRACKTGALIIRTGFWGS